MPQRWATVVSALLTVSVLGIIVANSCIGISDSFGRIIRVGLKHFYHIRNSSLSLKRTIFGGRQVAPTVPNADPKSLVQRLFDTDELAVKIVNQLAYGLHTGESLRNRTVKIFVVHNGNYGGTRSGNAFFAG